MAIGQNTQQLFLTGPQLCAAGRLLGHSRLLLPKDPFRGWLTEEIQAGIAQAQREISAAELINNKKNGDNEYKSALPDAISMISNPTNLILVNYSVPQKVTRAIYFYQKKDNWLSLKINKEEEYQLEILDNSDINEVTKRILDFIHIGCQQAAPGKACLFTPEVYKEAKRLAEEISTKACINLLEQTCEDKTTISYLATALSKPKASSSISFININGNTAETTPGTALLESPAGLWHIEYKKSAPLLMEMKPISGNDLFHRINSLIAEANR